MEIPQKAIFYWDDSTQKNLAHQTKLSVGDPLGP